MSDTLARLDEAAARQFDHFTALLERLVAQPSVAAQGRGIAECAALVADMLREHGIDAEVVPSAGNPVVVGEGGQGDRTLLFYLHYDVQPAEPLELWSSPPFELTERDGALYGRGSADDKGHIAARLAALAAVREVVGELPCRVKFVIEGEEEIGSPSLPAFVEQHRDRLAADACVWEFGSVDYDDVPLQMLGMRGICFVELSLKTADLDAHSGMMGSVIDNAAWRLVWALNTLKGPDERIKIPGFYDNVVLPTERDLDMLRALPAERWEHARDLYGFEEYLGGETDALALYRSVFRPTCTIAGLTSGYQGAGAKTIVPAEALAKIDFRLVPDQTPEEVLAKLRAHLDAEGFEDVEIRYLGGEPPARTDPDDPFVALVNTEAAAVYGAAPRVEPMIGGSGPNHAFIHHLNVPVVMAGVGYPGARAHAPDEHVRLGDVVKGIQHTARIIARFGAGE